MTQLLVRGRTRTVQAGRVHDYHPRPPPDDLRQAIRAIDGVRQFGPSQASFAVSGLRGDLSWARGYVGTFLASAPTRLGRWVYRLVGRALAMAATRLLTLSWRKMCSQWVRTVPSEMERRVAI